MGPQGLGVKGNNGYRIGSEDAPVKKRTVEKGYDPINEAVDPGQKEDLIKTPAKCWSGYKRVPGTKKGAKGSCKEK